MTAQSWHWVSVFFATLAVVFIIGIAISYFYPTTYVTWLGTSTDYPYRGYTWTFTVGMMLSIVASFIAHQVGENTQVTLTPSSSSVTVVRRYCATCGSEVPLDAIYCPKCGRQRI